MADARRELRAQARYGPASPRKEASAPAVPVTTADLAHAMDALSELAKAMLALAQRELPTPVVNVEAPVVHVAAPQVNVAAPAVTVQPQILNPTPRVEVHPQVSAPAVRVDAPIIRNEISAPAVQDIRIVELPPTNAVITRDDRGRIESIKDAE